MSIHSVSYPLRNFLRFTLYLARGCYCLFFVCLFGVPDYFVSDEYLYTNVLYRNFLRFTPFCPVDQQRFRPLFAIPFLVAINPLSCQLTELIWPLFVS